LDASWVQGRGFRHRVFRNRSVAATGQPLHIYLEGDGLPFLTTNRISSDPTPRNPLALRLLLRDPAPALYLGRPCYHGQAQAPGCNPRLWTQARYSEPVVASMAAGLQRVTGANRPLMLIGYSGGGTLAMLLAPRLGNVVGVVTIAANLDVQRWAAEHSFTPLTDSLDPARAPPLAADITQLHLAGARDREVPPRLVAPVVARQPHADLIVFPDFDHRCCWEQHWPALLWPDRDATRTGLATP
jgi:pimeloyl-ACP methyl ester carboxylesterase